jgi:hypothetical protein
MSDLYLDWDRETAGALVVLAGLWIAKVLIEFTAHKEKQL